MKTYKQLNSVTNKMEFEKAKKSLEDSYDALKFLWCDELANRVRQISDDLKETYKIK